MLKTIAIMMKIGGVGMIIASIFPIGVGIFLYSGTKAFLASAVEGRAIVTDVEKDDSLYYPVFTFTDQAGQQHSFRSSSGRYPAAYKRGDSVSIIYDPQGPQKARTKSFGDLWLFPILAVFMGIGSIIIGTGCLVAGYILSRRLS